MITYKKERKNNIGHFANTAALHTINMTNQNYPEEDINCVSRAIENIKNGKNILKSCQIIENEFKKNINDHISCQTFLDLDIIQYILTYIDPDTDYELLECAMNITYYSTGATQSTDSPLQDELFIQNLVSVFQTQSNKLKTMSLEIISNLLIDENVSNTVFFVLSDLDFLTILKNSNFLDLNYTHKISEELEIFDPAIFSSEILSCFSQLYEKEELICMAEFIKLLSQALIDKDCEPCIRKNFAGALSYILKNQNLHETALKFNVPSNCIQSLCQYHDESIAEVFDCIYYLIKKNKINEFSHPTFIRQCTHLLESIKDPKGEIINHILQFLDVYLPKYFKNSSDFIPILIDIVLEERPFTSRINASLVLLECIPCADQNYFMHLFEKKFFSFVFNNIFSFEKDDIDFIIKTILRVFEKDEEIKNIFFEYDDFLNMLDELTENDDDDISNLPSLFIQSTEE